MLRLTVIFFSFLALLIPSLAQSNPPAYLQQAFNGVNALQSFYTPNTGLYRTTGWWNSGNSITVLANYSRLDRTDAYYPIFANTLKQAALVNPGFVDGYYDDAGWWALAWIDVYDLTKQPQYLAQAASIFEVMTGAWDTNTCGGGVWWNTDRKYKNAITNELFLSVAGELAARAPAGTKAGTQQFTYLSWAQQEWNWFKNSGMINPQNQINDGLDTPTCKNNGQTVWSYNQGVVLGGLTQLSALTQDAALLAEAQTLATTAIARMTDSNGVFHDMCEPDCGMDGVEFKGVFSRNLMALNAAAPDPRYKAFADTNAESIFNRSQGPGYQFGQVWSGPFDAANEGSQNSALDTILAAAAAETGSFGGVNGPSFTLSAAPEALKLSAGASASASVTLAPSNGFSGTVALTVTPVGAPAGLQASLGTTTLSGTAQTTLAVSTTGVTPGGNYLVAVTGVSGSLSQTAYVTVQLPDFTLGSANGTAGTLYLNQSGEVSDLLTITSVNGFSGNVEFSLPSLPDGVTGIFSPGSAASTSTLNLRAAELAPTTGGVPIAVNGTSGPTVHALPSLTLAISAAASSCGRGTPINLASAYNVTALRSDGSTFSDGGLDGGGFAYSANLLGPSRVLNGILYTFGAPDALDGVRMAGQVIALPSGRFNTLQLLGSAVGSSQGAQTLTVRYTDGSTAQYAQGFSDWYSTALHTNEQEAVAMPYRNGASGTSQQLQFNVYGYTLALDVTKTVQSLTLPSNGSVVVLAASLSTQEFGREVNLANAYNATGIYTDGTSYPAKGGLDGGGSAYSANLLGDTGTGGADITVGTLRFHLAAANQPNAVYAAGQTVALPPGLFGSLKLLGTGVRGNQTAQTVQLNFEDGTSQSVPLDFSDWSAAGGFVNEAVAVRTAYRDNSNGQPQAIPFNVYVYTLKLNPRKPVRSITLPSNRDVVLLGMTLAPFAAAPKPLVCSSF